ncbi:uncharacterized protein LOC115676725 isoform X1 [Syzygium oleosum]|uniref:uncharacterized protein LOC115676725 isoform X1 n=1 Tax=Syzygium oleosum TaxID=219896 RepID=UPI0024B9F900|nr:uncharacterized protein LOC115676725 isoform X1 [Syzygium oleosum]
MLRIRTRARAQPYNHPTSSSRSFPAPVTSPRSSWAPAARSRRRIGPSHGSRPPAPVLGHASLESFEGLRCDLPIEGHICPCRFLGLRQQEMQHDEVIWQVIRHNHCSYMAKITTGIFCRNEYNVTGICNRSSCPLANSRYATIRDHDGVFYLYMKSIERAHMPDKLWERVKLPRNYEKALEIIDKHLMYWPKFLVHKTKQRLTKMTQMRIRMRKLALKTREKIMTTPRKEKKREARREEKAEKAAVLEKIMTTPRKEKKREARTEEKAEKAAVLEKRIEKELLERLRKGVYGDIYNYPVKEYKKILEMDSMQAADEDEEEEPEIEYVEGYDELDEELEDDIEDFGGLAMNRVRAIGDSGEDEDGDGDEDDDAETDRKRGRKESSLALSKVEKGDTGCKPKKRAKVLVEIEHENADERQTAVH